MYVVARGALLALGVTPRMNAYESSEQPSAIVVARFGGNGRGTFRGG